MRRASAVLLAVLIIPIALGECVPRSSNNITTTPGIKDNKAQQPESKMENKDTKDSQLEKKSEESKTLNFEIVTKTYVNKKVKINYPQISNYSNTNKQNEINDMIKKDILDDYQKDVNNLIGYGFNNYKEAEDALNEDINYYIKFNSTKLLSILYEKNGSIPGSMHPYNSLHYINISIENKEVLNFKDLVNADDSFIAKLKNTQNRVWEAKPLPTIESSEELNKSLTGVIDDELKLSSNKDLMDQFNSSSYSFYFTKDHFGMTTYVSHACGDFSELEIKYKDIKDNVKAESPVWKNFIN